MVGDVVGFKHADVGDTTDVTCSDDVQQVGDAGKPTSRLSHELRETDRVKTIAQLHVNGQLASPHTNMSSVHSAVRDAMVSVSSSENVDGVDIHCGRYTLSTVSAEPAVPTLSN